jgi:hypothetical protein
MKELSIQQLKVVSGGLAPPTNVYPGMNASVALRKFPGLGYITTAFAGGYAAGEWLNENTPIQGWIADMLPDPSGTNYNNAAGTNYN